MSTTTYVFMGKNKKNISAFWLNKVPYLELCCDTNVLKIHVAVPITIRIKIT